MMSVHQEYRLFISPDQYTLIGESSEKPQTLIINRRTNQLDLQPGANLPNRADQELQVYGLFGIISLIKCE